MNYLTFKKIKQLKHFSCKILFIILFISKSSYSTNQEFTIASYNVENLFDLQQNGTEYKKYVPFTHDWNLNNLHAKLDNISNVIKGINADIIVLTEIENQNILQQLQKELKFKSCNYKYYKIADKPMQTTTNVAILSKFPISNFHSFKTLLSEKKVTRNILEADISINNYNLKIFALHWPSKLNSESSRIMACKTLLERIKKLPRNTDYLIVGDLNSNYNESETFYTSGHDNTNGITAINNLLNTTLSKPNEPLCFIAPDNFPQNSNLKYHYNPWLEVSEGKRYSYIYQGAHNTLDHILLSEGLFDSTGISYIPKSFTHFTWGGRLLKKGTPYRWQVTRNKQGNFHIGKGYSDHLPILARFSLIPFSRKDTINHKCINYLNPNLLCGFESGVEGWITTSSGAQMITTDKTSYSGEKCLKISAKVNQNRAIAKLSIKPNKLQEKFLFLKLKGSGKIAILVKEQSGKTLYYSGPSFNQISKSVKYTDVSFSKWQKINLNLKSLNRCNKLTLIIKTYKNSDLELYIDDIAAK